MTGTAGERQSMNKEPDDQLRGYRALTGDAGYLDLGARTQIEIRGDDRATLLHNLCTNEIAGLRPGQGCEAFITNPRGTTLGHVLVFCGNDSLLIETVPDQAPRLLAHLDKYVIREDVRLADLSGQLGELLLAGPRSDEVWRSMTSQEAPAERYGQKEVDLAGHRITARRVTMMAPSPLLLAGPRSALPRIEQLFAEHDVPRCCPESFETARIEAGWPHYGKDINDRNLPQEVARDDLAISFTKGCYLGQETVARIDALGHVNRLLVGLTFAGTGVPPPGLDLSAAGRRVGVVTSSAYSPRLSRPVGLGYVRREHARPGSRVASDRGEARVVPLPITA
jgi:folate-binding protein YgfZ